MRHTWTILALALVALVVLAGVPLMAGWEEGIEAFTGKDYERAEGEFRGEVAQRPDDYRGYYMLGLTLESLGRDAEALENLEKAHALSSDDLSVKLALARALNKGERNDEAARLLAEVDVDALPVAQRTAVLWIRGEARRQSSDAQGAQEDFARLAALRPDDARVQLLLGSTALRAENVDEGITALEKALELDPLNTTVQRSLVSALVLKGGQSEESVRKEAYERAAEIARELAALDRSFDTLLLLSSTELAAGYPEPAAEAAREAIAERDDWQAHFYLGQAYAAMDDSRQAEQPLRQALAKTDNPEAQTRIWQSLGYLYETRKEYSRAIDAYQRAGNQQAVARVEKNRDINRYNDQVERDNRRIETMSEEARRLEEELRQIEKGEGSGL